MLDICQIIYYLTMCTVCAENYYNCCYDIEFQNFKFDVNKINDTIYLPNLWSGVLNGLALPF